MPPEDRTFVIASCLAVVRAGRELSSAGMRLLADEYIADHPADDDETVTAEWLDVLGFEYGNLSGLYIRNPRWSRYETPTNFFTKVVPHPKTRGDVRRLCRALGIELKEPT